MSLNIIDKVHSEVISTRRMQVLRNHLAELMPKEATVLDVGTGSGLLASMVQQKRPDLSIHGLEVLIRDSAHISITPYDGAHLPEKDKSYDVVSFVDVLHHTDDPNVLLREAARVARKAVIIKDHLCEGSLDFQTLKFMDNVGNKRFGVALPYNYWPQTKWREAFARLQLFPAVWQTNIGLYPPPLKYLFDRSLHFITRLEFKN